MNWLWGDATWSGWGWWWLVPLACMVLCFLRCRSSKTGTAGRTFPCWSSRRSGDLERIEREIGELRHEIKKVKENGR